MKSMLSTIFMLLLYSLSYGQVKDGGYITQSYEIYELRTVFVDQAIDETNYYEPIGSGDSKLDIQITNGMIVMMDEDNNAVYYDMKYVGISDSLYYEYNLNRGVGKLYIRLDYSHIAFMSEKYSNEDEYEALIILYGFKKDNKAKRRIRKNIKFRH